MKYSFRNLIFEGGGVKGIAYVGSLGVLEQKGILKDIKRVGGTSAGAINSLLLGLGYSNDETLDVLSNMDFKSFLDDSVGILRDLNRLRTKYGFYKGDVFTKWAKEIVKRKTGKTTTTFKEAKNMQSEKDFRDMYFVGTNLSTECSEVFSFETTPDMPLYLAVRISMSIPFFWEAIRWKRTPNIKDKDCYVDGGVLRNYPIKLFDRKKYLIKKKQGKLTDYYKNSNRKEKIKGEVSYIYNTETLGFRLDSKSEIEAFKDPSRVKHHKIKNIFEFTKSIVETIYEFQNAQHLYSDDWHRTVYIDTLGVKTTEFDLSDQKKKALVKSGKAGTLDYFKWFDDTKHSIAPSNRI